MDLRVLLGPLYASALCAACVAAFVYGRRDALRATPRLAFAWSGMLLLVLGLWAAWMGVGPAAWLSGTSVLRLFGAGLLMLAAGLAVWGARLRRWAEVMLGSAPRSVDEAIAALQRGEAPDWGVFRGRLGTDVPVKSPGGASCAFFQAEVREVAEAGGRGRLLSAERACPSLLYLRGEKRSAAVSFDPSAVFAPVRIHRCAPPGGAWAAAGVGDVGETLSYEQIGGVDEACLVAGRLSPGPTPGSYVVRGGDGVPATLVLAESAEAAGRRLARRAFAVFAASVSLCLLAAWVMAGS